MFCTKCGAKLPEDSRFCNLCGAAIESSPTVDMKTVKCQRCDGTMSVDRERQIMSCPYCGSTELIIESDDVSIERIRSRTVLEHDDKQRQYAADRDRHELEKMQYEAQQKREKDAKDTKGTMIFCGSALLGFGLLLLTAVRFHPAFLILAIGGLVLILAPLRKKK